MEDVKDVKLVREHEENTEKIVELPEDYKHPESAPEDHSVLEISEGKTLNLNVLNEQSRSVFVPMDNAEEKYRNDQPHPWPSTVISVRTSGPSSRAS